MSNSFSSMLLPSSARAASKFRELFLEAAPLLPSAEADVEYTHEVSDFVKFFDSLYERLRQILRIRIRTAVRPCGVGFLNARITLLILPFETLSFFVVSFFRLYTNYNFRKKCCCFIRKLYCPV